MGRPCRIDHSPSPFHAPMQMAIPVSFMIGREITMSSLREWAAAAQNGAHKGRWGGCVPVQGEGVCCERICCEWEAGWGPSGAGEG